MQSEAADPSFPQLSQFFSDLTPTILISQISFYFKDTLFLKVHFCGTAGTSGLDLVCLGPQFSLNQSFRLKYIENLDTGIEN